MNEHPKRCETCADTNCEIHPKNPQSINEDTGRIYDHFIWYYRIIGKKGCDSHKRRISEIDVLNSIMGVTE